MLSPSPSRTGKPHRPLRVESLEERRLLTSMPYGASPADLGEFMLGSVAVTPVFLESNGQIDQSTEDWTETHIQEVLDNIDTGLQWWGDTLDNLGSVHELQFTVDTQFASSPVETAYEPISRRSNDYSLYVREFLDGQGFASGSLQADVQAFNHAQREELQTDWSFTMFVVPSENDPDGQFAAGGSFSRAFAFAGGLFMVVPSTRPASTFAHETGHMFWARDEYAGGGSYFSRRGYYNTQNTNAADNPNPGFEQQPSIMASGSLLLTAYENNISPASTLAMIGWQDSNGNGVFDVLDVPHRLTGSGYFDAESGEYRFSGSASVQALPNLNSSGLKNDITLNRIREIEFRFDGGDWQVAATPGSYVAEIDLSIPVPDGATEIEIRARDSRTTVESNRFLGRLSRADATVVAEINGAIWIDDNEDGLRDLGEFGEAGWQVALVDSQGNPLSLEARVEPDDYPSGIITSGFRDDVVFRGAGSDADGRVGIFDDSVASTGTKTFRAFSKSLQSYSPLWNNLTRRLQADFNTPTSVVSIDAIGASSGSRGRLEAYNLAGELLGRYTTGRLQAGDVERMTIQRSQDDIAYVLVGGHTSSTVRLDDFRFGPQATTQTAELGLFAIPALPDGTYTVQVTPPDGYIPIDPHSGRQTVEVVAGTATTDVDFGFQESISQWQNPVEPLDVNDDGFITPIDALLVINRLNERGAGTLVSSGMLSFPYVDVTGDSVLSPLDALRIINYLNARTPGEGEGGGFRAAGVGAAGGENERRPTGPSAPSDSCGASPLRPAEGEFWFPPPEESGGLDERDAWGDDRLLETLAINWQDARGP